MSESSLLDAAFLRRLAGLRLAVRRRLRGATQGARRSTRRGSSAEFADHRAYSRGDDIRRIDWRAFARLEQLVLRLYVAEEDLAVHLLIDTSRSLDFGTPTKLDVAKRLAAGLGYLGLAGNERVSITTFAETVTSVTPVGRGRRRVGVLLRALDAIRASGATDLASTVSAFLARKPRQGLVIVLSDLLDPQGFERPLDRLLGERHEVVLFHVLSLEERAPKRGGDVNLVDAETGERVALTLDADALALYERRFAAFLAHVERYARKRGVSYVRIDDGERFEDTLLDYLRSRR
jgi:uncharacterized protein (DUF58 family)